MGTVVGLAAARLSTSFPGEAARTLSALVVPQGCKGPACPAFALCQGRCAPPQGRDGAPIGGAPLLEAR